MVQGLARLLLRVLLHQNCTAKRAGGEHQEEVGRGEAEVKDAELSRPRQIQLPQETGDLFVDVSNPIFKKCIMYNI